MIYRKEATMKLNPNQVRQGDVMLVRVGEKPPKWAREVKRDGKLIVEHGEMTGHGHRIADADVTGFRAETAEMAAHAGLDAVLVGGAGATMRHEYADGRPAEHAPAALAPGCWERAIQVDEDEEDVRRVID